MWQLWLRARRGQELAAYVIAKGEITPGQLLAHCRRQLTPYKVPRQICIVPELPRNLFGKVDKRALIDGIGADATQPVDANPVRGGKTQNQIR
jgi:acyl-coenzyme A synthetase/AMP-(fatty) acid ligase